MGGPSADCNRDVPVVFIAKNHSDATPHGFEWRGVLCSALNIGLRRVSSSMSDKRRVCHLSPPNRGLADDARFARCTTRTVT